MPRAKSPAKSSAQSSATIGFEAKLWLAADKLRNNMDAAEYKHVVLGLIFLKYISDKFEEHHARLVAAKSEGANPEDKDEYLAAQIFWVPKEARWSHLQSRAKLPSIGQDVDDAMVALERDNPSLKGSLNKNYGRADLDKHRLGELIDLIGSIQLADAASRSKDLLGRVFEYFLTQFASAEGKNGGQFYTPSCVVRLLVEMLAPYKGRIYDPACGSGGMFVQSEKFVESHGGKLGDISIYGQESNPTTRRLAVMNLALRGIEADFGPEAADTFRRDLHPDLRADYVLANPPFNDSDWFRKDDDVRWQFGVPPKGNANFAWVQHFIPHGWTADTIKNRAANIQYGFTQSATKEAVGPHFLRITDISGGGVDWAAVPFCHATNQEREKYRILDGDILIARTGASTGDNIYVIEPPTSVFASYLIRIQFSSRGVGRLVGEFTRTADYASHVAGTIGGSAQPNASAQALAAASMVFPTEPIAEAFYQIVRPLDLRRAANDRETRTLATLRDTLLPKLLSGELTPASLSS